MAICGMGADIMHRIAAIMHDIIPTFSLQAAKPALLTAFVAAIVVVDKA